MRRSWPSPAAVLAPRIAARVPRAAVLAALPLLAVLACSRPEPPAQERPPGPPPAAAGSATAGGATPQRATPTSPPSTAPAAAIDCGSLAGANPVQTEMRQLECAFQQAVSAFARDDLPSIARSLGVVHAAKDATAAAIAAGTWRPARGEVAAFVALDEAFHRELEALYDASEARDHGKTGEAMGRALGLCQACHATYREPPPPAP